MKKHLGKIGLCFSLLAIGMTSVSAAPYYYDRATNVGWLASNAWSLSNVGSGNTTWVDGSVATFGSGTAFSMVINSVSAGATVAVAGMTNTGSTVTIAKGNSTTADTISFSGGAINGDFIFGSRTTVTGSFEVQSGNSTFSGANLTSTIVGTVTVSGGIADFTQAANLGATTNITNAGGITRIGFSNSSGSTGALTINSGTLELGRAATSTTSVTVSSLAGSGGLVTARNSNQAPVTSLIVSQTTTTTYSGAIDGTNGTGGIFSLTKSGTGTLTLSGSVTDMVRTTTVNGGRLYINGATTSFGDASGTAAISVASGGNLGGTGTITTLAGDSVVVANGGALTAGLAGTTGKTTYALGTGSVLDISAATAGTGWLNFDLGATTTPGTSYDQIIVSSGTLLIGSGQLDFADFSFTAQGGFGSGTYLLFDNAALSGTLAASGLSGTISGLTATLSVQSGDIVLTVVPEPSTVALLVCATGAFLIRRRARKLRHS